MSKLNILALDPATITGWAHSCGASGVWNLRILRDESSGMRLIRFRAKLREVVRAGPLDVIAYEGPNVASGAKANMNAFSVSAQLQGIILEFCETVDGIECSPYNLQTIKSHALRGKEGARNKEAMIAAAQEKWPHIKFEDDNQVDAMWLLDLAQSEIGGAVSPDSLF